jgi:hypothetical protein
VILACRWGETSPGEILPAINGEMIHYSFTLKHGKWDFSPSLMVKIIPFCLYSRQLYIDKKFLMITSMTVAGKNC